MEDQGFAAPQPITAENTVRLNADGLASVLGGESLDRMAQG